MPIFLYTTGINEVWVMHMIQKGKTVVSSPYMAIYDIVVPRDNLLRRINDLLDFSFVYDELKHKYCHDNVRNAIHSIRMFKYLPLKILFDLSDVDVYDMYFKYFLDMPPEEAVIEPSSLTKFRKLHLQDMNLLDMLIHKIVEIAIEKGIIKSKTIINNITEKNRRLR